MLNRIQVMMTDELVSTLDELAKTYGLSRSALCNYLIANSLLDIKGGNKNIESLLPKRGDK